MTVSESVLTMAVAKTLILSRVVRAANELLKAALQASAGNGIQCRKPTGCSRGFGVSGTLRAMATTGAASGAHDATEEVANDE